MLRRLPAVALSARCGYTLCLARVIVLLLWRQGTKVVMSSDAKWIFLHCAVSRILLVLHLCLASQFIKSKV